MGRMIIKPQGTIHFTDSLLGEGLKSFKHEEHPEKYIYTADELKEALAGYKSYSLQLTIFHELARNKNK